VADTAMPPYLNTIDPNARWRMEGASRRSGGRVLVGSGAVVSAHELAGVEAGAVLGRSARWRRERKGEGVVA
jgi:hypothetical protein